MAKYAQGRYNIKFQEKYIGRKAPLYRSSWEFAFMKFCDENPNITKWASEAVKIPYVNPFTGKQTVYVPDFFINYMDKNGKQRAEVIEVKPDNQTTMESAGRNKQKQMAVALNMAKWQAARAWCRYEYIIVNNDLQQSFEAIKSILIAERTKQSRRHDLEDLVNKLNNEFSELS